MAFKVGDICAQDDRGNPHKYIVLSITEKGNPKKVLCYTSKDNREIGILTSNGNIFESGNPDGYVLLVYKEDPNAPKLSALEMLVYG